MNITQDTLSQAFHYDATNGRLVRTSTGLPAGSLDAKGYRVVMVNWKTYKEHRLIWLLLKGKWPDGLIDHINRVKNDNRIENLRESNPSNNAFNTKETERRSETGLLGVSVDKSCKGAFRAKIKIKGRQINLGSFKNAEDAHAAYLLAKKGIVNNHNA